MEGRAEYLRMFAPFMEIVQGLFGSPEMKKPRYLFPAEQALIMQYPRISVKSRRRS